MATRISIGLGLIPSSARPQPTDSLCAAIADRVLVTAEHKGKAVKLAPHVVYRSKHDANDLRLDAVTVERDGKPNKAKLESFKFSDLSDLVATSEAFTPDPGFDPDDPEYADKPVCII